MKARDVLKVLGICRQSLHNYVKDGRIKVKGKLNSKFYEYDDDSVYALIGKKKDTKNKVVVSYARVSTQKQKEQLKEQNNRIYNSCIARGIKLEKQYKDIKSGMTTDREGLQELVRDVIQGNVCMVVIENKDRLIRFNYELLEQLFKYYGCTILILNDILDNKTYEQELTDDLISVIHYFTMKSYSHRRKLNKLRKELENQVV